MAFFLVFSRSCQERNARPKQATGEVPWRAKGGRNQKPSHGLYIAEGQTFTFPVTGRQRRSCHGDRLMACPSHKTRGRTRHENAFLCPTGGRMAGKVCGHTVKHGRFNTRIKRRAGEEKVHTCDQHSLGRVRLETSRIDIPSRPSFIVACERARLWGRSSSSIVCLVWQSL